MTLDGLGIWLDEGIELDFVRSPGLAQMLKRLRTGEISPHSTMSCSTEPSATGPSGP